MSKTELFVRKQSGGMYVVNPESKTTGNIFWVDSGNTANGANSAGYGQNPDAPFLTIDYAIGNCTANNGDVIYVMPGHAETRSVTGNFLAHDVAGVSVIGLGAGVDRPTLTFSHTGAATTISVASARWENLLLVCGVDSVTAPLTISATDCTLKNVEIRDAANVEFVVGVITTAAADRLHIDGLQYRGDVATGNACVEGVRLAGCDDVLIENSIFDGIASTAWVNFSVAVDNVHVRNCVFNNVGTALTLNVVDTATGSTWDAIDCWDLVGGYGFSGGSGGALASDDVSGLAGSIAVIDEFHDVPAANNVLNAQINEVIGNKTDVAASGAVTATDTLVGYIKQLVTELAVVDEFHDVPGADNTLNAQINEVIGNKTDAAATGAVTATDTLVGYIKQLVTELAVVDEFHDVPLADNVSNAQINEVIGNKTDATASGAVTVTDTLVGYIKQLVTELAVVDEYHDVPGADNTLNAQINEVIGNKSDAAAAGVVTATDTLVGYIKQLVTELAVVDELHDVPLADNTLNAQINEVIGNKSDAAAAGAVTATDTLVGYVKQLVTELAVVDEFHDVPAADNTLNAQINEVIGNKTDAAAAGAVTATDTLMGYAKQLVNVGLGQEISIQKVQTTPSGGADALFTITGGPILVRKIVGIVTTVLANAGNGTLQATVTEPANTVALSTTVAITGDAAGTSYRFIGATGVLTPVDAGAVIIDPVTTADCEYLVPIGNINFLTSAAMTGAITWYMSYIPLSPSSVVAAA